MGSCRIKCARSPPSAASRKMVLLFLVARRLNVTWKEPVFKSHTYSLAFLSDPNCKLEDKAEDGEALDCKKRPEDGEELEDEAVHSCDSCLQVFESLSDITEHKINQCQLTGKQYLSLLVFAHCSISDFFQFVLFLSLSPHCFTLTLEHIGTSRSALGRILRWWFVANSASRSVEYEWYLIFIASGYFSFIPSFLLESRI